MRVACIVFLFTCRKQNFQEFIEFAQSLITGSADIVNPGLVRAWRASFLWDWLRSNPSPVKTGLASGNADTLLTKWVDRS